MKIAYVDDKKNYDCTKLCTFVCFTLYSKLAENPFAKGAPNLKSRGAT